MTHIHLPPLVPPGSITVQTAESPDGQTTEQRYVPAAAYDALLDLAGDMRRTLALAQMHLSFSESGHALRRIRADTGLDLNDARVMRGLVAAFATGDLGADTT